ncbi:MAG: nucleotidyltransferase domain-containing protein [Bacilli bacterium]
MRKNTWADDVRITHSVCAVIEDYLSEIRQYMPDTLDGFYLHGSIALGAFIEHASDIDFVAVVKRELTQVDLDALASIHGLKNRSWTVCTDSLATALASCHSRSSTHPDEGKSSTV